MATHTTNYNLTMPAETDFYDVAAFNENFAAIDGLLAENEGVSREINEKIGTPEKNETVFSLLKNGGGSVIKSIQRVTYSAIYNKTAGSVDIKKVDPAKTIVLFERLNDTSSLSSIDYTLTADSINLTHEATGSTGTLVIGFWVVEFI